MPGLGDRYATDVIRRPGAGYSSRGVGARFVSCLVSSPPPPLKAMLETGGGESKLSTHAGEELWVVGGVCVHYRELAGGFAPQKIAHRYMRANRTYMRANLTLVIWVAVPLRVVYDATSTRAIIPCVVAC